MSLLNSLKDFSSGSFLRRNKNYPELVNDAMLTELRQLAQSATPTSLDINLEVHQKMLGERLSPFAKSGFEFAETRLYQPGDNVRFINWRRYANTGDLYINTFHEERRPQCWLIMDRRAGMRFGTRVRLKATQAAIYTLYHLFKAQQHQMDVGGVVLDQQLHWYDAKSSTANIQPLIQDIIAPCPPMLDKPDNQLSQALRLLNVRLQPGSLIVMVSDFADLSDNDTSTLNALADKHALAAVQVVDPIEASLPGQGQFNILQQHNQTIVQVDCNNTNTQQQVSAELQARLSDIQTQLKQCRVQLKQVYSDEGVDTDEMLVSS